ncbi:MAG: N-glycosylase/DNA lyase [Promethearchaeota archaeon]
MEELISQIEKLKNQEISQVIKKRINEFSSIIKKGEDAIFSELCFCIFTANCSAEKCIEVQKKMGNNFINLSQEKLAEKLKSLGYRFPNKRAEFIVYARKLKKKVIDKIYNYKNEFELRNWLAKNIKGLGLKEASHFLRNIGFKNLAIVDFHIVDILVKYKLINKPKSMNKTNYLKIESILQKLAERCNLNNDELDLYLWYIETNKVLK